VLYFILVLFSLNKSSSSALVGKGAGNILRGAGKGVGQIVGGGKARNT